MTTRILINNLNHRINELQAQVTTNNEDALHNPSADALVMQNVGISGISSLSGYQTNEISLLSDIDLDHKSISRVNDITNDANLNIQTTVELGYIDLKTNISQLGNGKSAEVVIYNDSVAIGTYNEPNLGGYKSMVLDSDNDLTFTGGTQNIYNPLGDIHSKSLVLTAGGLGGISFSDGSIQTSASGAGGGGNMNNPSLVDLDMSNHDILNVNNLNHPSLINLTTNVENSVIDIYTNKSALTGSSTEIFMDNTHIYIGSYDTPSSSAKYLQLDLNNDLTFTGGTQNITNTLGTTKCKSLELTEGGLGGISFSDSTVQSTAGGKVDSVVEGSYIGVDITDPINPIVNLELPTNNLTNNALISTASGVLSWTTLGISAGTFYCNDNSTDLREVLVQVGSQQGCQIIMSSGTFAGADLVISQDNLAIIGPRCSPAIVELVRGVTVDGTRIRISNIQIDGLAFLTGNACRYSNCDFMNDVDIGSEVNTRYITVENCEFTAGKTININATYNQEPVFFINCNFGGCFINLNSLSPLQIVFNNCSNFIALPNTAKATLIGLNVVVAGSTATVFNTMNKVILGTSKGTAGQVLTSGGVGNDTWTTVSGGSGFVNPAIVDLDMATHNIDNVGGIAGMNGTVGLLLFSNEIGIGTSHSTIQLNDTGANIQWSNLLSGDLEQSTYLNLDINGLVVASRKLTVGGTMGFVYDNDILKLQFSDGTFQQSANIVQDLDMANYNITNINAISGILNPLRPVPYDTHIGIDVNTDLFLHRNSIVDPRGIVVLDDFQIATDGAGKLITLKTQNDTTGLKYNELIVSDNGTILNILHSGAIINSPENTYTWSFNNSGNFVFPNGSIQNIAYTEQFINTATNNFDMANYNIENVSVIGGNMNHHILNIYNDYNNPNASIELSSNGIYTQWNNDALGSSRIATSLSMDQLGFNVNCQKLTSGNQSMGFVIDNDILKLRFSDGTFQSTASTGGGGGFVNPAVETLDMNYIYDIKNIRNIHNIDIVEIYTENLSDTPASLINIYTNKNQLGTGIATSLLLDDIGGLTLGRYKSTGFTNYSGVHLNTDNNLVFTGGTQNITNALGITSSKSLVLTANGLGSITFSDGSIQTSAGTGGGFVNPAVETLNMNYNNIQNVGSLYIQLPSPSVTRLITAYDHLGDDIMIVSTTDIRMLKQIVIVKDYPLISKNGYSKRDDNQAGDAYTICGNYSPVVFKSFSQQPADLYPPALDSVEGWNTIRWNDRSSNLHQISTNFGNFGDAIEISNTSFLKISWSSTVYHGDNNQTRLYITNTGENIYGTLNNTTQIINTTSTGVWIGKVDVGTSIILQHYVSRATAYGMGGNDYISGLNVNATIIIEDAGGYKDQF